MHTYNHGECTQKLDIINGGSTTVLQEGFGRITREKGEIVNIKLTNHFRYSFFVPSLAHTEIRPTRYLLSNTWKIGYF